MNMITEKYRSSLPPYWRENKVAIYHFDAAGKESDLHYEKMEDIASQLFIATATWGLEYWEYLFRVNPLPGDSYEVRRARVISKYRNRNPFTPEHAIEQTNLFLTPEGKGKVQVMEDPDSGQFVISVPLETLMDLQAWVDDIKRRKRVPHKFLPNLYKGGAVSFISNDSGVLAYISQSPKCDSFSCGGAWDL